MKKKEEKTEQELSVFTNPLKRPVAKSSNIIVKFGIVINLMVFLFIMLINSVYTVKETETAIVTTFGVAAENTNKGLQFKIPFVQNITKVDTTVKGFPIGFDYSEDGKTYGNTEESTMITMDFNLIDLDYYISYRVTDPIKFLYASDDPELILKNIAMNCIRSTAASYSVDSVLTIGKAEIQSNIRQTLMNKLEKEDIGISLVDASMQDVDPPTDEVKQAFKDVETARQEKESAVNLANQYRNEQLPAAEAEVDKIKQEAIAQRDARINEAKGQAARFKKEFAAYKQYPLITKQRMFYETMEELLPNMKVVIDNGDGSTQKFYPIERFADINLDASNESDNDNSNHKTNE